MCEQNQFLQTTVIAFMDLGLLRKVGYIKKQLGILFIYGKKTFNFQLSILYKPSFIKCIFRFWNLPFRLGMSSLFSLIFRTYFGLSLELSIQTSYYADCSLVCWNNIFCNFLWNPSHLQNPSYYFFLFVNNFFLPFNRLNVLNPANPCKE